MARPRSDIVKRFLEKIKAVGSGCHEWQFGLHRDGYGKFQNDGKTRQAHRIAYALFVGEIPENKWVLHRCDNRKCVNPEHLFLGDRIDNINDMDAKGRRGTRSKITSTQAEQIKKLLAERYSQQHIADLFGIDQTTVSKIKLGKTTIFKN